MRAIPFRLHGAYHAAFRLDSPCVPLDLRLGLGRSAGPDRSSLSYEENVLINTACASVRARGDVTYYDCVEQAGCRTAGRIRHPTGPA